MSKLLSTTFKSITSASIANHHNITTQMNSLNQLYSLYFKLFRSVGVFPFNFDPESITVFPTTNQVRQRAYCIFNIVFILLMICSEGYLLIYNYATEYQYETMKNGYLIQCLWFTGAVVVLSIFGTLLYYAEHIAQMLTTSLRLEQTVFEAMNPADRLIKKKRRINLLKIQLIICGSAVIGSPLGLIPINIFFPRFPPFLNSLFLKDAHSGQTELDKYLIHSSYSNLLPYINYSLRYIFYIREAYFGLIAWSIFGSFDIFLNVIFSILVRTIEHVQSNIIGNSGGSTLVSNLNLYTGIRPHLIHIQSTLGGLIFQQEMLNIILNALVLYAALVSENALLLTFFIFNSFSVTLRMYVFYLPISNVHVKSRNFIKVLGKYINSNKNKQQQVSNGMLIKKVGTLRDYVLRPMGLHRITPSSIMDYILAVLSYMIVAIKT